MAYGSRSSIRGRKFRLHGTKFDLGCRPQLLLWDFGFGGHDHSSYCWEFGTSIWVLVFPYRLAEIKMVCLQGSLLIAECSIKTFTSPTNLVLAPSLSC
ncbi:unnamed protein product [Urochloa humidicola]